MLMPRIQTWGTIVWAAVVCWGDVVAQNLSDAQVSLVEARLAEGAKDR